MVELERAGRSGVARSERCLAILLMLGVKPKLPSFKEWWAAEIERQPHR